jgi:cyclopropane-fatty-acyl-phospholipid synthase
MSRISDSNPADPTNCYEHGQDILKVFLNSYMKFSSGLYLTGKESPDEAARQMLDRLLDQGQVKDGKMILDIGSGWGCLRKRIGERSLKTTYVAVNPSSAQNEFAQNFLSVDDKIIEGTLADLKSDQKFDSIFLIGSFCHLENKPEKLRLFSNRLAPGGRLVIEETFFISEELREHFGRRGLSQAQDKIYGWAEALSLSRFISDCANAGLTVEEALNITESYKKTGQSWVRKLYDSSVPFSEKSELMVVFRASQIGWNNSVIYMQITLRHIKG